nr:GHKL domain-containing protein [Lacticaseibacillus daqingensis]
MTILISALASATLVPLVAGTRRGRVQLALIIAAAGLAAGLAWVGWGWAIELVAAGASAGWFLRQHAPLLAGGVAVPLLLASGLTPWLGVRGLVAGVVLVGGGLIWRSQQLVTVRLALVGLGLAIGASLWLTTGGALVAATCTALLAVLTLSTLIQRFLAQQDAVFAHGLDQMMAQYSQEVQTLYANMRGWRHDYHDHLQALKAYLDDAEPARARAYLDTLEDKLDTVDTLVHSGNPMLDAIVNAKLTLAERAAIPTNVKVFVGTQPLIADLDLVVIVGNLLDNALEAITAQPAGEKRRLRVYIAILKQQLYISVTNTRPVAQQIDLHYASTKDDRRGLGIRRINQLVAKYDGVINRQYEDEVFVTEIALPLTGQN